MHARALQPGHVALQIHHAWKSGAAPRHIGSAAIAGLPFHLCFTLPVVIAEFEVGHLNRYLVAGNLPMRVARQLCQRNQRVVKQARQCNAALAHHQRGLSSRLRQVKIDGRAPNGGPWHPGPCDLQTHDAPFCLVLLHAAGLALPGRLNFLDHALGRPSRQAGLRRFPQWQAAGNLCQRRQVKFVGLQLAPARALRGAIQRRPGVIDAQVPAGPAQTVLRLKLQVLRPKLKTVRQQAATQTSGHRFQGQRCQLLAKRHVHIGQRDVGRGVGELSFAHVQPSAKTALPSHCINAQIHIATKRRHIDPVEHPVELTVPLAPLPIAQRQQRLPENPDRAQALAHRRGQRGVQAHFMRSITVSHHQIDPIQIQGRQVAHVVGPLHGTVTDDEFILRKKPVGNGAVAGLGF